MARSRELTGAVALVAGLASVAVAGPGIVLGLSSLLRAVLLDGAAATRPGALAARALSAGAALGAPLLLVPAAAAGAAGLLQTRGSFSLAPLQPRLDRLSPAAGLRRLLGPAAIGRALLALAKATILFVLLAGWLAENGRALAQLPRLPPTAALRAIPLGSLALRLALALVAAGLVDLALATRRHRRDLRMTREEVRREAREDEGDPRHRAERRRLHRDLLGADPVSRATVVVVNPTRLAVALGHRRGGDEAPRLLAKGVGDAAARIRSAARRAGVPIVRDVPLARAVLRLVEVGEELPPELYEAAAAVLAHVYGPTRRTE